jgi:hypothetical protein
MAEGLAETRRATDAYIRTERPFIVVEVREGLQFWLVNKGKSPARFHFLDDSINEETVDIDTLPNNLDYGPWYMQPHLRQNNVPWLGAGEERRMGEATGIIVTDMLAPSLAKPETVVYGGIIYTGLDGVSRYETTYFYRGVAGRRFEMAGRHGWNKNT